MFFICYNWLQALSLKHTSKLNQQANIEQTATMRRGNFLHKINTFWCCLMNWIFSLANWELERQSQHLAIKFVPLQSIVKVKFSYKYSFALRSTLLFAQKLWSSLDHTRRKIAVSSSSLVSLESVFIGVSSWSMWLSPPLASVVNVPWPWLVKSRTWIKSKSRITCASVSSWRIESNENRKCEINLSWVSFPGYYTLGKKWKEID